MVEYNHSSDPLWWKSGLITVICAVSKLILVKALVKALIHFIQTEIGTLGGTRSIAGISWVSNVLVFMTLVGAIAAASSEVIV